MAYRFSAILVLLLSALAAKGAELEALSARAFERAVPDRGVVIFKVNWGRKWGCAHLDNAQLTRLTFSKLPVDGSSPMLEVKPLSKLFVKDNYTPYAYIAETGTYALVGFDVLAAKTQWNVGHIVGTKAELFESDSPKGGTFTVGPNEVVYIGHFALDCNQEAIPWRYYIDSQDAFDSLVAGFRKAFPFAASLPVKYRLFDTSMFGQAFSLPVGPSTPETQ